MTHPDDFLANAYTDNGYVSLSDAIEHANVHIVANPNESVSTRKCVAALVFALESIANETPNAVDLTNAEVRITAL